MAPAIEAAFERINNRSDIFPGFSMSYEIKNSKCDGGNALKDVAELKQMPNIIIGPGCSSTAVALEQVTSKLRIPMLSPGTTSTLLADKTLFARMWVSQYSFLNAAMSVAESVQLKTMGGVIASNFRKLSSTFASTVANKGFASGGVVNLYSFDASSVRKQLRTIYAAACRCVFALMYAPDTKAVLNSGSVLFDPGTAWITSDPIESRATSMTMKRAVDGWLKFVMQPNRTSGLYQAMEKGFTRWWEKSYKKSPHIYKTPQPAAGTINSISCTSFNAVAAVAQILHNFIALKPPLYYNNPDFPELFMQHLKLLKAWP